MFIENLLCAQQSYMYNKFVNESILSMPQDLLRDKYVVKHTNSESNIILTNNMGKMKGNLKTTSVTFARSHTTSIKQ